MLDAFVRNYLHLTWSTKERARIFHGNSKIMLKDFVVEKSTELNTSLLSVNIQPEHLHLLIDLPANLCLSDFMQKIKGASSHWVNQQKMVEGKFAWQRGYGAFSESSSQLEIVKNYIRNRDEHHKKSTFEDEYQEWKHKYGFYDE
jgi:REP element-mobilizing transposase RayT